MGNAFQFRMPAGIPGDVTRHQHSTIEPQILDTTDYPTVFGVPVVIDGTSHALRHVKSTDLAKDVNGFYVRPYPIQGASNDPLGTATPPTSGIGNVLKRGYMNVLLNGATAAVKNAPVYVRVANTDADHPLGGVEAAADVTVAGGVITGTGTGTIAASVTDADQIVPGTYSLVLQTTSATSKVTVIDPNGKRLADATVGTAYNQEGLGFTITSAGTMTAGDSFAPVVTGNTFKLDKARFTGPADADDNAEISYNV